MSRNIVNIGSEKFRKIGFEKAWIGDYLIYKGENDNDNRFTKPERIKRLLPGFKFLTDEGNIYDYASRGPDWFDVGFCARRLT